MLVGEILLFGGPLAICVGLFFFLGLKISGIYLVGLTVAFPFALFFFGVTFFSYNDSVDVAVLYILIASAEIGAIAGALTGFAVKKYKNNKRQE